jgi:hypothetical protein
MTDINQAARYASNWQDERNSAALYRAISEAERNPQLREVYRRMAEAEERHSAFWEAKLRAAKQAAPRFRLSWRTRALISLARRFGPDFVLPNIVPLEQIDSHNYDQQPEARAGGLPKDEQSHARLLKAITGGSRAAGLEGSRIAQLEGRHRAIGAGITLPTGRSVLYSGARQVLFGLLAAAITFALGRLIGATIVG